MSDSADPTTLEFWARYLRIAAEVGIIGWLLVAAIRRHQLLRLSPCILLGTVSVIAFFRQSDVGALVEPFAGEHALGLARSISIITGIVSIGVGLIALEWSNRVFRARFFFYGSLATAGLSTLVFASMEQAYWGIPAEEMSTAFYLTNLLGVTFTFFGLPFGLSMAAKTVFKGRIGDSIVRMVVGGYTVFGAPIMLMATISGLLWSERQALAALGGGVLVVLMFGPLRAITFERVLEQLDPIGSLEDTTGIFE